MKICKVENCNVSSETKNHGRRGYCRKHYQQVLRYGEILKRTVTDSNEIVDCGDYCEIILYKGYINQTEIARTKIDKDDLEKVKGCKWGLTQHKNGYVITIKNNKKIRLHKLILGDKNGLIVDHINRDKLDNRKQNLRHCTYSQNSRNRKSKGYCFHKWSKKWIAYIMIDNKKKIIGYFKEKKDAILARLNAEKLHYGDFACKNKKYED